MSDSGAEQPSKVERLEKEIAELEQAMDTRPEIDQARGMIMALVPCSAEDAWEILVETSQRTNVKLREVAAHLVATTTGTQLPGDVGKELAAAFRRHRPARP